VRATLVNIIANKYARVFAIVVSVTTISILSFIYMRAVFIRSDLPEEDIASAWNDGIRKIGLIPVYPPIEDFSVGDVWAIVGDPVYPGHSTLESGASDRSLTSVAIRVGHIDLRAEILDQQRRQIHFRLNGVGSGLGVNEPELEVKLDPSDEIRTSLVALPTVNISSRLAVKANGSFLGNIFFDSQRIINRRVEIPIAESYGIQFAEAAGYLEMFCKDEMTSLFCNEKFLRGTISRSISTDVLLKDNGRYIYPIGLQIVSRVYLTRKIVNIYSGKAEDLQSIDLESESRSTSSMGESEASTGVKELTDPTKQADQDETESSTVHAQFRNRTVASSESSVKFDIETPVPVVFGYRAVSRSVE